MSIGSCVSLSVWNLISGDAKVKALLKTKNICAFNSDEETCCLARVNNIPGEAKYDCLIYYDLKTKRAITPR